MTQIVCRDNGFVIAVNGTAVAKVLPCPNAEDQFTPIESGVWKWTRRTEKPTDRMRMELVLLGKVDFTMVPGVSYNGNGWGDIPEYLGDRDADGTPWSWAYHRTMIPSCTYSENGQVSLSLMAEANSNSACSLYAVEEGRKHVVIFPEEEKPRTLQRHFWGKPFQGSMEPQFEFTAIIQAVPGDGSRHRYKGLLDFAWRYYGHPLKAPRKAEELHRSWLDVL